MPLDLGLEGVHVLVTGEQELLLGMLYMILRSRRCRR